MRQENKSALAEPFAPTAFYPAQSSPDDQPTPQPVVALTAQQAEHLRRKGWIAGDKFLKPIREQEQAARIAEEQAEEARNHAAAELEKQRQADEAAQADKAKRDAEEIAAEARRQDTPSFFIAVAKAAKKPFEERRSWISGRLVWLSEQLGTVRGWSEQSSILAKEAIALHNELSDIRDRIAAIDSQLDLDMKGANNKTV
jgi:hypothetical protein